VRSCLIWKPKKGTQKLWVQLKDTHWIIQDDINVIDVEWVDTSNYDWAIENPWKYAENTLAIIAEDERKKILQRIIGQEIRNAKRWYQVRESNYWFQNETIIDENWKKKKIQVENPEESIFMKKMYELKINWYSDMQICNEINSMWYISRTKNR